MRFGLSKNRLWYIRRAPARYAVLFFISILFLWLLGAFAVRIQPVYFAKSAEFAKTYATEAVNRAVNEYLRDCNISTEDLVKISEDSSGRIKAVKSNSIGISKLQTGVSDYVYQKLREGEDSAISIPIGSAVKNPLFSALGYRIKIKILPAAAVTVGIHDEFSDAGINQVKRMLYLDVSVDVSFFNAVYNQTENISTSLLIADTVIVGDVPGYYGASAKAFAAAGAKESQSYKGDYNE